MGSKFLFLSETVRDVVDLKLSTRFIAPTNILGNQLSQSNKSYNCLPL